jgi:hypothetical protein
MHNEGSLVVASCNYVLLNKARVKASPRSVREKTTITQVRQKLLESILNLRLGGHSGEMATHWRLKLGFIWLKMHSMVKSYVQRCPICHKKKSENVPYPGLLQPLTVLDMALSYISMDFVEALPKFNGKNVILVVDACLLSLPTF